MCLYLKFVIQLIRTVIAQRSNTMVCSLLVMRLSLHDQIQMFSLQHSICRSFRFSVNIRQTELFQLQFFSEVLHFFLINNHYTVLGFTLTVHFYQSCSMYTSVCTVMIQTSTWNACGICFLFTYAYPEIEYWLANEFLPVQGRTKCTLGKGIQELHLQICSECSSQLYT